LNIKGACDLAGNLVRIRKEKSNSAAPTLLMEGVSDKTFD